MSLGHREAADVSPDSVGFKEFVGRGQTLAPEFDASITEQPGLTRFTIMALSFMCDIVVQIDRLDPDATINSLRLCQANRIHSTFVRKDDLLRWS